MKNTLIRKNTARHYKSIHGILLTGSHPVEVPKNTDKRSRVGIATMVLLCLLLIMIASCHNPSPSFGMDSTVIVKVAQSQIGKGEMYGNNKGPQVKEYTRGQEVAWCSGFVSWVVNKAGKNDNYFLSAKSWLKAKGSKRIANPRSGDIIVFSRGNRSGHVGIVEKIQGDKITTIEGNVGEYPAKVKRVQYTKGKIKNLLGYVRLT